MPKIIETAGHAAREARGAEGPPRDALQNSASCLARLSGMGPVMVGLAQLAHEVNNQLR